MIRLLASRVRTPARQVARDSGVLDPYVSSSANATASRFYDASKRALDIVLAAALFVLTLPIVLFASTLIFVSTRRAPLLRQTRVGEGGREFGMLKLRTMRTEDEGADPMLQAPGDVLVGKTLDDPRVTRIGRVLRRTSIDELPQLLNVLAGEMSLVGPRPGLPAEVARYPRSWRRRLSVKPGLTGLWQVSGRSDIRAPRRFAIDRYYIRHRSFALDCLIIVRTVFAALSMRGAW